MSRILLLAAALSCVAIGAHQTSYWLAAFGLMQGAAVMAGAAAVATALAYVGLRSSPRLRRRAALELVLLVGVLLGVELLVTMARPDTWTANPLASQRLSRERLSQKLGVEFDTRTISEVVQSLRAQGVDALPGIGRSWARQPAVQSGLAPQFYPLSHASLATVVECNEGGEYFVYETDELGFHNPRGLLISGQVDIAVVGESYALGHCVRPAQGVVNLIRQVYPLTVNLGLADTRSLSQLASFREYVEPLEPPVVLWVVNPGLAVDSEENSHPVLARYLDPAFSQGLVNRQDDVDAVVRSLSTQVQAQNDLALRDELARARAQRFAEVPKLRQLRQRLGPAAHFASHAQLDLSMFNECLRLAREAVARWNGYLVVVVLPAYGYFVGEGPEILRHETVIRDVRAQGIPLIDGAALFLMQREPTQLFAFGAGGHPNAAGNRLLAKHIVAEIERLRKTPPEQISPTQEMESELRRASGPDSKSVRPRVRPAHPLLTLAFARE